jgi:xeroderma pigmentosum group C-complementing protein
MAGGGKLTRNVRGNSKQATSSSVPREYLAMMRDIHKEASKLDANRPIKRRGVSRPAPANYLTSDSATQVEQQPDILDVPETPSTGGHRDPTSSGSDDDDVDWEEVTVDDPSGGLIGMLANSEDEQQQTVTVNLQKEASQDGVKSGPKKRVLTKDEKIQRQNMHMFDLIALLSFCAVRNSWCNDAVVRESYRRVFPVVTMQELRPPDHLSTSLKSRKFMDGLRHAASFWQSTFSVTSKGLYMTSWKHLNRKDRVIERRTDLQRFRKCLTRFRGSSDVAAQGFCAALRAVDIDARLVCSLQPLDFTSNEPVEMDNGPTSLEPKSSADGGYWDSEGVVKKVTHDRPMNTSAYPVFWVEAWDIHGKQWISIDPIITNSVSYVRRQSLLEPHMSDASNILRYVVAFAKDGTAKDVTRRYAFRYNARTRKKRITITEKGAEWWHRVMKYLGPKYQSDRDVAEDRYLRNRELSEEMPSNLQDFKNHPRFALEMHLKQTEILDPKTPCGRLARKQKNGKTESIPIYPRENVKTVKSAQQWYKLGRIIKVGAQPLKYTAQKRRNRKRALDDDSEELESHVPLYGEAQTEVFVPPPVVDGMVPKNAFGNIDVYVPTMIPVGAVHLTQEHTDIAAKLIDVDFAKAVVGFDFSRGQSTPKFKGIVVAEEYKDAVLEVYQQLLYEQEYEDRQRTVADALLRWRKYIIALRIRERLAKQYGEVAQESEGTTLHNTDKLKDSRGRLCPDGTAAEVSKTFYLHDEDDGTIGFDASNDDDAGGFIPGGDSKLGGGSIPDDDEDSGGFLPSGDESAGAFIPSGEENAGGFIPGGDEDGDEFIPRDDGVSLLTPDNNVGVSLDDRNSTKFWTNQSASLGVNEFKVPQLKDSSSSDSDVTVEGKRSISSRSRRSRSSLSRRIMTPGVVVPDRSDLFEVSSTINAASSESANAVVEGQDSRKQTLMSMITAGAGSDTPAGGDGSGSDVFPESISESELLGDDDDL